MILNPHLQKAIQLYSDDMQLFLNPADEDDQRIVQKGLILFLQQYVTGIRFSHKKMVGTVMDVVPAQVELFYDDPTKGTCSCPEQGICRHQLALFFSVLSKIQSVYQWLDEWKARWNIDLLSSMERDSDLIKDLTITTFGTVQHWLDQVHVAYENAPDHSTMVEPWLHVQYEQIIQKGPKEQDWKELFHLFVAFESLLLDIERNVKVPSFTERLIEEGKEAIHYFSSVATSFAFDEYFHYMQKQSHRLLWGDEKETLFYFELWTSLFHPMEERLEEWYQLHSLVESHPPVQIGLIHLGILLGKNEDAIRFIEKYGPSFTPFMLYYLELLPKKQLDIFVPSFLQQLENYAYTLNENEKADFAKALFFVLRKAYGKLEPAVIEKMYMCLLPESHSLYSDFLLSQQEYRKWVALELYVRNRLDYIEPSIINVIANEDPEALLPLYHTSIMQFVNERNRIAYQKAVRYLKKLRILYRNMKKMDEWEQYFTSLMTKTKRLRAFQEECQKGKLLK